MPAFLQPGSKEMNDWLNPAVTSWTEDLQNALQPYKGKLTIYRVSQDVNKVGHDGDYLVVPLDQLKGGIKFFFGSGSGEVKVTSPVKPKTTIDTRKRVASPSHIYEEMSETKHQKLEPEAADVEVKHEGKETRKLSKPLRSAVSNPKPPLSKEKKKNSSVSGTPKITNFFKK